jgi:hypothetical protein
VARWIVTGLLVLLLGGQVTPAAAEPPGKMTVAEWRSFLAMTEQKYDERAARAVEVFFAVGAMSQEYLLSECLRGQTVLELREWLRNTAPPELTLLEALWLNAHQRGCQARAAEDVDAELAIWSGQPQPEGVQ